MRLLSLFVTGHPRLVLGLVLALSVLAVAQIVDLGAVREQRWSSASRVSIDPSLSGMLPARDPDRLFHDRFREIFGSDDTLLIVIHADAIFRTDVLAALTRTTGRIEALDRIDSVVSLANAADFRDVDGDLVSTPFFEEPPEGEPALEHLAQRVAANPILSDVLVSEDTRTTAIVIQPKAMTELEFFRSETDVRVLEIAEAEFDGIAQVWLSGGPRIKAETRRAIIGDLARIIPLVSFLLAAIAFLSFGTLSGVLVPLINIGLGVLWTVGLAGKVSPHLNLVTATVPAILLGVGFAYTVHVVSAYYEAISTPGEAETAGMSAAARGMRKIALPTILTGLTTAAGFSSLATHSLIPVRQFGILAAAGVGFTAFLSLTFVPAVLALLPERLPKRRSIESDWINRLLTRTGRFDLAHQRGLLAVWAFVAVLSVVAIPRIHVSTNMVNDFPESSSVRKSFEAVDQHFGVSDHIYVVLESAEPQAFVKPENLRRIAEIQDWLAEQPEVSGSTSLADYVKLLNRVFHEDDPSYYRIPETNRLVDQLLFFGGGDELRRFADPQMRIVNVAVRVRVTDTGDVSAFVERLTRRLEALPSGIAARATGSSVLVAKAADAIAVGQAVSLGAAFLIIYGIMVLLFSSLRVGLIAMIPNLLPVVVYFGMLGWMGITLNLVTGLVAPVVLGIAVDDTIHFISRFTAIAKTGAGERRGVTEALLQVGRPVTYTTAALCASFLVLTTATLRQQVEFGALSAFTLGVAWLADLTLTPALAARMRLVNLWDIVTLDLGPDPQREIRLFSGLSSRQARIVALMTSIEEHPAGHRLIEIGEKNKEMFIVIDGTLKSTIPQNGTAIELNVHGRGDLVGEIAAFQGERTARVECLSAVRLLRLDDASLEGLVARYPRIAARLYRNISEVVADRLTRTTHRLG